jgi:hypothetical protein
MSAVASAIQPNTETGEYHRRKYELFHRMYNGQLAYGEMMSAKSLRLAVFG